MGQDQCPRGKRDNAFRNYIILARFYLSLQSFGS